MLWIYPQLKVNRDSRHKKKPGGDDRILWAPGGLPPRPFLSVHGTMQSRRHHFCGGRSITQFDCSIFVGSEVGSRSQATGLNFRASPRASVVVETCQAQG